MAHRIIRRRTQSRRFSTSLDSKQPSTLLQGMVRLARVSGAWGTALRCRDAASAALYNATRPALHHTMGANKKRSSTQVLCLCFTRALLHIRGHYFTSTRHGAFCRWRRWPEACFWLPSTSAIQQPRMGWRHETTRLLGPRLATRPQIRHHQTKGGCR